MIRRMLPLLIAALTLEISVTTAAEVVQSKDGRTILLKEDGTYESVAPQRRGGNARSYLQLSPVDIALDREKLQGRV